MDDILTTYMNRKGDNMPKVYLAGGWFTPEMEEEHTRIFNTIKNTYDVFNPREHSFIHENATEEDMNKTLMGNVTNIDNADIVVVIYDGKDTGTIWESGYAYAKQKPIIYYAEKLNGKSFNLMLAKTGLFASNEQELLEKLSDKNSYNFKPICGDFKGDIE